MHILFLTDNFPPEVNAPASRTFEHCRQWVKAGHEVTVITCAPNFPRGRVFDGYRNSLRSVEMVDGIRVVRVWSYITANEGFARRVLDYMSFMVSATFAGLFQRRVDVVVATSPQFFSACAGWAVGLCKRVPYVFELRDIWPESIKAVGAMGDSRLFRLLERMELFLYRRAARIVSVTHSFRQNLIERGIDGGKIDVITNGVDLSRYSPRSKDAELELRFGLRGCFVAGYIGTHGLAHGLDTILEAAARLQQRPDASHIRLLLLGDGANKQRLQDRARELGLRNLLFVDSVPKEEVVRWWSLLDVSIIHLRRTELFGTVIPSKLFECMGMGVPVLHGVAGESAEIVERERVGRVFEAENSKELEALLVEVAANRQLLEGWRSNCLVAAGKFDRKNLADLMLSKLLLTQRSTDSQVLP
jgi:glycosyltransferase involved in cell wall biosynthesis